MQAKNPPFDRLFFGKRLLMERKSQPMFYLETERLIITEFTPEMAQAVHENSLDEDNRRFVPDEVFETVEDAAETIEFLRSQYGGAQGPFVYPVLLKDGTYVGYVQAVPLGKGEWEIGYHIGARYTKRGYAAEAVRAFLPVIMKQLGITEMTGLCLAANLASRRVMEKTGFISEYEGIGNYQGAQQEICRYRYRLR